MSNSAIRPSVFRLSSFICVITSLMAVNAFSNSTRSAFGSLVFLRISTTYKIRWKIWLICSFRNLALVDLSTYHWWVNSCWAIAAQAESSALAATVDRTPVLPGWSLGMHGISDSGHLPAAVPLSFVRRNSHTAGRPWSRHPCYRWWFCQSNSRPSNRSAIHGIDSASPNVHHKWARSCWKWRVFRICLIVGPHRRPYFPMVGGITVIKKGKQWVRSTVQHTHTHHICLCMCVIAWETLTVTIVFKMPT